MVYYLQLVVAVLNFFLLVALLINLYKVRRELHFLRVKLMMPQTLTASAVHDIKNPLAVIRMYADIFNKAGPRSQKAIQAETDKIVAILDRMLDEQKANNQTLKLRKETFNLSEFLSMKVETAKHMWTDYVFVFRSEVTEAPILADKIAIDRIVNNLLQNSIKHSPSGSTITVKLRESDSHYCLAIKDQGEGIPRKLEDKVFEPFYQVQNSPGVGLGLYVVKLLVKEHGGKVWFDSRSGKGTTFYVELPRP